MTKLTLSSDPMTIQMAKDYALRNNTSVSALFTRFVHGIESQSAPTSAPAPSTLDELSGVISIPDEMSYGELKRQALKQRYEA
ncbi:hypothetical protein BVY04_00885 [bacterium M21]|nr:hypothetical protein BVY04_00885 [bacterium M21]